MATIIFDFDGTLADSFQTFVGIFYELSGNSEIIPPEEIERLRGLSIPEIIESLRIPPWKIPFMIMRGRQKMSRLMPGILPHPGVLEAVDTLHAEGHQLYILSSNSEKNIRIFLSQHSASMDFINIYGSVGLFSKGRALKKLIRRKGLDRSSTWYVGDEIRDVQAAHYAKVPIAAVSWGFNTPEVLAEHEPTKLVYDTKEMLKVLQ